MTIETLSPHSRVPLRTGIQRRSKFQHVLRHREIQLTISLINSGRREFTGINGVGNG